jgi:glyoxylase I family protein
MPISAVSHISLTVSDLEASKAWYAEILGWRELMPGRTDTTTFAYGVLPGEIAIVLRQHDEPETSGFDPRRPGLDHLSLAVSEPDDLTRIEDRLRARDADFTATVQAPFGHQLTLRDPDGTALELICPAS